MVLGRVPPQVRTVVAGAGLAGSPVVLAVWLIFGGPRYVLPVLAAILALGVLRRRPEVALGVLLAELVVVAVLPVDAGGVRYVQIVVADLALGYVAAARGFRFSAAAAVAALAVQLGVAAGFPLWDSYFNGAWVEDVLGIAFAWTIGYLLRQRRLYRDARRAQTEAAAVQAERLRIARELHDMVAHSIGVIAFQAGMGRRVLETQPAEARNALQAIEETSRETLAGLRRLLSSLRRAEGETAPLDPAPGLAALDALVAQSADAGVRVEVRRPGEARPLPPDIDLSAFRIIQEAVTNVVRHAGTTRCEVVVEQRDEQLLIEVTDDGHGKVGGSGYGIAGMRERVALLHGDLAAGPRPEGGFRVVARIPLPAAVR